MFKPLLCPMRIKSSVSNTSVLTKSLPVLAKWLIASSYHQPAVSIRFFMSLSSSWLKDTKDLMLFPYRLIFLSSVFLCRCFRLMVFAKDNAWSNKSW
jgi:hypothetical protein